MSKKDSVTKEYFSDNTYFADVVNYFVYDGEQVVDPSKLKPLDSTEVVLPFEKKSTKVKEDFEKFQTELRQVFKCIKYSKDKEKFNNVMHEDEAYSHISRRTAVLLNTVAGMKIKLNSREEDVNMCKAIEDMLEDARKEERKEINRELENTKVNTLSALVNKGIISISQAAEEAGMSESEFEAKMKV